jgi:hypothetical protein
MFDAANGWDGYWYELVHGLYLTSADQEEWMMEWGAHLIEGGVANDYTPYIRASVEYGSGTSVQLEFERFGTAGNIWVAPVGAATVPETVEQLVDKDIYVVSLFSGPDDDVRIPSSTTYPLGDSSGWGHASALAHLTGAVLGSGEPAVVGLNDADFAFRTVDDILAQLYGYIDELATSISAPNKIDVAFLLDNSGSFSGADTLSKEVFRALVDVLRDDGRDMAVGVAHFSEYSWPTGSNSSGVSPFQQGGSSARPFQLTRTITELDEEGYVSITAAVEESVPAGGGDTPETGIEALYQLATGAGFDSPTVGLTTYTNGTTEATRDAVQASNDPREVVLPLAPSGSTQDSGEAAVAGTSEEYNALRDEREIEILEYYGVSSYAELNFWQQSHYNYHSTYAGVGYNYPGLGGDVPALSYVVGRESLDPVTPSGVTVHFSSREEATVIRLPSRVVEIVEIA